MTAAEVEAGSSEWWALAGDSRLAAHQLAPDGRSRCLRGRRVLGAAGWLPVAAGDDGQRRCAECLALVGLLTPVDLLTAAEITYRQLDYWSRAGLLRSTATEPGSGRMRAYPPGELRVARVMAVLTAAGVTPEAAARVARTGQLAPGVTIHIQPVPEKREVIMGKYVSMQAALPNGEESNGLIAIVDEMIKSDENRVAIIVFSTPKVIHDRQTGVDMPVVRVRAIEPINDPERAKQVRLVMGDIHELRTGERELELEFKGPEDQA